MLLKSHFTVSACRILPIEWLMLWGMFVAAGMMMVGGYPLLLPSPQLGEIAQMLTVTGKYSKLIGSIFGLYLLSITLMGMVQRKLQLRLLLVDIWIFLRLMLCLAMAIYLMQAFKWWSQMQLQLYDQAYWDIDNTLSSVKSLFLASEDWLGIPQIWYFYGFSWFFVIPYMAALLLVPDLFLRLMSANMAVMLLGGIAYTIAPADGPLLYGLAGDPILAEAQQHMLNATHQFRESGFMFNPALFDAVLGAMPSLHVAHVTAIVMVIAQYNRGIAVAFVPPVLFICAYSVVTHFHYLADIPAGLVLAVISVGVSTHHLRRWEHRST